MHKFLIIAAIAISAVSAEPKAKPGVIAAAAPVAYSVPLATSSQVFARNYNALAAPYVAAPAFGAAYTAAAYTAPVAPVAAAYTAATYPAYARSFAYPYAAGYPYAAAAYQYPAVFA